MTNQEQEQLTNEFFNLHKQVAEWGRKSVPVVIECGRRLNEMRTHLIGTGTWGIWCAQHKKEISDTTIRRLIRVYLAVSKDQSLVTDNPTLDELYIRIGILKKDKPKTPKPSEEPEQPEEPQDEKKPTPMPDTKLTKWQKLIRQLQDIKHETFTEEETTEIIWLLDPVVVWYHQNKPVEVEQLQEAA